MKSLSRITVALLLAASVSCAGKTRDRWLEFFFDDPPAATPPAAPDSLPASQRAAEDSPRAVAARTPEVLHSPYEDRDCASCHSLSSSKSFSTGAGKTGAGSTGGRDEYRRRTGARLLTSKYEICYECHDDMTAEALAEIGEFIHSPVEEGECVECHDPHKSRYPSLLRVGEPFEKLCFLCHDLEDIIETDAHADLSVEERRCIRCHDPHVSDKEYLLRQ